MTTMNASDSYRIKCSFVSAFAADNEYVNDALHGKRIEVSIAGITCLTNGLLWECIVTPTWRKYAYSEAVSLLKKHAGELFVLTDAVDNERVSADAPVFAGCADEVAEFLNAGGFWNFYVFDADFSWCIIFTDECEAAYPEGVCFANME